MNATLWDKQWEEARNRKTDIPFLSPFGKEAFRSFGRWITEDDREVLEAGSGTGQYCVAIARKYPATQVTGLDLSLNAVRLGNEVAAEAGLSNATFIEGDIFHIPFEDGHFDVVFNEGVIEHFHGYGDAFREMVRVTKPGGKVIVCVPNFYCFAHTLYKLLKGKDYEYGFEKSFRPSELHRLFRENCLTDIELSGFAPLYGLERLPAFKRLAKVLDKMVAGPLDGLSGGKVSRTMGFEIVAKGVKAEGVDFGPETG